MPISQARPCPFCSSTTIAIKDQDKYAIYLECERCGAKGPQSTTVNEAIENWNGEPSHKVYFDVVEE